MSLTLVEVLTAAYTATMAGATANGAMNHASE
jgi:hypothetical protein